MGGGAGGTLIIHPNGLSDITLNLDCNGSKIVPLQSLRLNERRRQQMIYDQAPPGEGGEALSEFGPLVSLSFSVIIKESTRAAMIEAYDDVQAALLNRTGGTIEYKPDDVGASVLSTFYHYVQSPPPALTAVKGNRWDASAKSDGKYTLIIEVEFLTQPIATSDPDSPDTLTELALTLQNWQDDSPAQTNRVTISASNLKGNLPALLRFMARPGASQYLGRLIVFKRDSGECTLANFVCVYEAEDSANIYPSVAWTSVADSDRGDGNYLRCLPPETANGVAQGRRFTISNPGDHKGRFAVFAVGYDDASSTGVWTHQAKVVCGNIVQEGKDDWEAEDLRSWGLIYCGEFELPVVPLSDAEGGYDTGPYVDLYSTRASGASEFRLDGLILVYVSDSERQPTALDLSCEDVDIVTDVAGVSNSEKLLIENFPDEYGLVRELAHAIAESDGDFKRMLSIAPRGDFLMLDPTVDNLLVFVQEQTAGETILDDTLGDYKGSRWRYIAEFESDESWNVVGGHGGDDTVNYVEGAQGIWTETLYAMHRNVTQDFSDDGRFADGDYICLAFYLADATNFDYFIVRFFAPDGSNTYTHRVNSAQNGWNFVKAKKSDLTEVGSPDWSTVVQYYIIGYSTGAAFNITCDYMRVEKADPDDATNPNATGNQWNFQPLGGRWTITEDVSGAGATLACLDVESGVEKSVLIDETTPANVQFRARVMAKRDAGYAGILWRAGNDTLTEGAEDCYAALLDIANDKLLVREYAAGAITQHANPDFTCAVDTWYVVGVIAKGSTFRVYATEASNLTDDDDVFAVGYLLATVTDATLTSGKCGVMSVSTLGRFDAVKLVSLQDKVIPADTITLEGKAIWRTIAPFRE